jgi:hypothetical protein
MFCASDHSPLSTRGKLTSEVGTHVIGNPHIISSKDSWVMIFVTLLQHIKSNVEASDANHTFS